MSRRRLTFWLRSPGEPMTLGNMRHLGVQRLVATWLNDACRHQGVIDVSKYPDDIEVQRSGVLARAVRAESGPWVQIKPSSAGTCTSDVALSTTVNTSSQAAHLNMFNSGGTPKPGTVRAGSMALPQ